MKLTHARHFALWQLLLLALAVPVVIALLLLPARALLTTTDVAMLQLLWVTWIAQQAGQRWAIITTISSVLALDWFFVTPYYTLYIHHIDYLITFIVMLLLGSFIGRLSGRLRIELARAKKHMRQRQLLAGKTRQARFRAELEHSRAMLLRSISHDLRTPLATIMGASSMLADSELTLSSDEIREQAANIYRQSSLLSEHFDKVMELSRVQQPQHTLARAELDVADVVSAAISRRAQLLSKQPLQIQLSSSAHCQADSTLLEIALANMLENAVRHGAAPVTVSFNQDNGYYLLRVSNAIASHNRAQRDSGTGLGTAICKAVMQLHAGQFSLHSSDNQTMLAQLRWPATTDTAEQNVG
ncbi:sensor histidine kinase [Rheinheimera sp. NSM]|uniref:sensor histidine kinase n=1 Tax=Rheinheimera sp. NSM TaxID=3457884 RepID=UPI004036CF89